jgi:hypothetical protein
MDEIEGEEFVIYISPSVRYDSESFIIYLTFQIASGQQHSGCDSTKPLPVRIVEINHSLHRGNETIIPCALSVRAAGAVIAARKRCAVQQKQAKVQPCPSRST